MKVKEFHSISLTTLTQRINAFLSQNVTVVDIKYSSCCDSSASSTSINYSVLIFYN